MRDYRVKQKSAYFFSHPDQVPSPTVEDDPSQEIQALLVQRLREIPQGQVTAHAMRGGIAIHQLARLRRGENTDIRLSTLARLARALNTTPAALIAASGTEPEPLARQRQIDPRVVRGLIRKARAFVNDVERYALSMAAELEAEGPAPPDRRPPGRPRKK